MISIGQYRPEKNQIEQLRIIHRLLSKYPALSDSFHLNIVGGTRNDEDRSLMEGLMDFIKQNNLLANVSILSNISEHQKIALLYEASIGLHTMRHEHFGISIVEMMV